MLRLFHITFAGFFLFSSSWSMIFAIWTKYTAFIGCVIGRSNFIFNGLISSFHTWFEVYLSRWLHPLAKFFEAISIAGWIIANLEMCTLPIASAFWKIWNGNCCWEVHEIDSFLILKLNVIIELCVNNEMCICVCASTIHNPLIFQFVQLHIYWIVLTSTLNFIIFHCRYKNWISSARCLTPYQWPFSLNNWWSSENLKT